MVTRRRLLQALHLLPLALLAGLALGRLPGAPTAGAQPPAGLGTPTPTPAPANVFTIPGTGQAVRESTVRLLTSADGITAFVRTTSLPEGRFTLRWVIFNNPQACAGSGPGPRCSSTDLGNPQVQASVIDTVTARSGGEPAELASGMAVRAGPGAGELNLRVRVNTSGTPAWQVRSGRGLVSPERAEIQLQLLDESGQVVQVADNLRPSSALP